MWRANDSLLTRFQGISCVMQPRHRNPVAGRPYVRSDKHQMVRQAVVDQLSASGPGRTSEDLVAALAPQLPLSLFPTSPASVGS